MTKRVRSEQSEKSEEPEYDTIENVLGEDWDQVPVQAEVVEDEENKRIKEDREHELELERLAMAYSPRKPKRRRYTKKSKKSQSGGRKSKKQFRTKRRN